MKQWSSVIKSHPEYLKEASVPVANDSSIHEHTKFGQLFHDPIPDAIPGFECEDAEKMADLWPAGTDAALKVSPSDQLLDASCSRVDRLVPYS